MLYTPSENKNTIPIPATRRGSDVVLHGLPARPVNLPPGHIKLLKMLLIESKVMYCETTTI